MQILTMVIGIGPRIASAAGLLLAGMLLHGNRAQAQELPPRDFKVAFIGDQGYNAQAEAVLGLVKSEGARLLIHLGDFDYGDKPSRWESQTDKVLGRDFPQFAVVGNHDQARWAGDTGYYAYIKNRMERVGVRQYAGRLGVQCAFKYQGIFFVFTSPNLRDPDYTLPKAHDAFIREQLALDNSVWRISGWHVNQRLMQAGSKSNEAGWPVYEESRKGGAIIATAHEHSYSRTHLLSDFTTQAVASRESNLRLSRGRSFAFVSGLGGAAIRPQDDSIAKGAWWASVYTATQNAAHGALFATFNAGGVGNKAEFYFKDIKGKVVDRWTVFSDLGGSTRIGRIGPDRYVLEGRGFDGGEVPVRAWELSGREIPLARDGRRLMLRRPGGSGALIVVETLDPRQVRRRRFVPLAP